MSHVFYVLAVSEPNVDDLTKQRSVFAAIKNALSAFSKKECSQWGVCHVFYVLAVSEPNVDDMTKLRSVFAATKNALSAFSKKECSQWVCDTQ